MQKPEFLDGDPEVMVVDRMTPLELLAQVAPIALAGTAAFWTGLTVLRAGYGQGVVVAACMAVAFAFAPAIALSRFVRVDFLLDRREQVVLIRRRVFGREFRSVRCRFPDVLAVRVRGRSVRGKGGVWTSAWVEMDVESGPSVRLTDAEKLLTADDLEAQIERAEPIAAHLGVPVIPASLTRKAAVTPARCSHVERSRSQWVAIIGLSAVVYAALLAWPLVALMFAVARDDLRAVTHLATRSPSPWSAPLTLVTLLACVWSTRARVTIDTRTQRVRRDACTFLVPVGSFETGFDRVAQVALVCSGPIARLEVQLRDARTLPISSRAEIRDREGMRLLLEADGRTAAAMMGVPFVVMGA